MSKILGVHVERTEVLLMDGGNGFGATDTKIRRMTNVRKDTTGVVCSYVNNATNGLVITALKKCIINVTYLEMASDINTGKFGISYNAESSLTTNIDSVAQVSRLAYSQLPAQAATNIPLSTSCSYILNVGDRVRPHVGGSIISSGGDVRWSMTVTSII